MNKLLLTTIFLFSIICFGQNEKSIDNKKYEKIKKLSEKGELYAEKGEYKKALEKYWKAYDLIPNPKTEWEASLWLLTAIGDSNFLNENFKSGVENFTSAMNCPNGIGNPFLHLRLGQCQYEMGNLKKAAEELTRAYAIEGKDIFDGENSKYFEFLKTKIRIN